MCNTEFLGTSIDKVNIYIVGSHTVKGFTCVTSLNCQPYW